MTIVQRPSAWAVALRIRRRDLADDASPAESDLILEAVRLVAGSLPIMPEGTQHRPASRPSGGRVLVATGA